MNASYLQSKSLLEHTVFWLFIYFFIFDYHLIENNWVEAIGSTLLEIATYAVIVYLNLCLLIPFLLKKKGVAVYLVSMVFLSVSYIYVMRWSGWEQVFYQYSGWRNVFSMLLNTSLFLLISSLYWYFKQWQIEREKQFILKSEKLEAELSFLRSQISPHFIFNSLNNIYTLALQNHENTAPMVAKLSTFLRYVLYEGSEGKIGLKKETDTLKQYIELHLLRKPLSQNIDFYAEGNQNEWYIVPMLLINFVENAFKHSNMDNNEMAWIKINSSVNEEGILHFLIENSVFSSNLPSEASGIGLQNVKRQLELNYPNQYQLNIKQEKEIFSVALNVQLAKR